MCTVTFIYGNGCPLAYRTGYIKQLVGHVVLTSFSSHHIVHIGAYSLNNVRLG